MRPRCRSCHRRLSYGEYEESGRLFFGWHDDDDLFPGVCIGVEDALDPDDDLDPDEAYHHHPAFPAAYLDAVRAELVALGESLA